MMVGDDSLNGTIDMDFSKLKVQDLKKELKLRGLSTTGNKSELAERLQMALKTNDHINSESVDELEEELLNDEDDEHVDASESILEGDLVDETLLPLKRKIETSSKDSKSVPAKKVILNRNISISEPISIDKPVETSTKSDSDSEKSEQKKVIKLSELSAKERLEMRAKKFGVTDLSLDAKKVVRAERFASNSSNSITSSNVTTTVDVLKNRAARFGISVSTVMSNIENKEKLEKRKQRFSSNPSSNGLSEEEKAKLRLQRFKEPVT